MQSIKEHSVHIAERDHKIKVNNNKVRISE